jgi:hypothetical protein
MPWAVLYEVPYLDMLRHRIWILWDLGSALRFVILFVISECVEAFWKGQLGLRYHIRWEFISLLNLGLRCGTIPLFLCDIGNALYSWLIRVNGASLIPKVGTF